MHLTADEVHALADSARELFVSGGRRRELDSFLRALAAVESRIPTLMTVGEAESESPADGTGLAFGRNLLPSVKSQAPSLLRIAAARESTGAATIEPTSEATTPSLAASSSIARRRHSSSAALLAEPACGEITKERRRSTSEMRTSGSLPVLQHTPSRQPRGEDVPFEDNNIFAGLPTPNVTAGFRRPISGRLLAQALAHQRRAKG